MRGVRHILASCMWQDSQASQHSLSPVDTMPATHTTHSYEYVDMSEQVWWHAGAGERACGVCVTFLPHACGKIARRRTSPSVQRAQLLSSTRVNMHSDLRPCMVACWSHHTLPRPETGCAGTILATGCALPACTVTVCCRAASILRIRPDDGQPAAQMNAVLGAATLDLSIQQASMLQSTTSDG